MPAIMPVSDLRSYTDVISEVSEGSPVFLTKNGRGAYVVLDMRDYDKMQAAATLAAELSRGRELGEEQGWVDASDVRSHFARRSSGEVA